MKREIAGSPNHPKKCSANKDGQIHKREDQKRIEQFLAIQPRNKGIFVTGCNTDCRAIDLTRITIGQVRGARAGFQLVIPEKKTGKVREVVLNAKVCDALDEWLAVHPWVGNDNAPLFANLRTGKALTVSTLSRLVKRWCKEAGLVGNYASHSIRKSLVAPNASTKTSSSR